MVLVGRVARPHGIRGQVVVNPDTDFVAERFYAGAQMWTRVTGALEIAHDDRARHASRDGGRYWRSTAYATVEGAEELAGAELRVPESELQPLPERHLLHAPAGGVPGRDDGRRCGGYGEAGGRRRGRSGARRWTHRQARCWCPWRDEICVGIDVGARVIRVQLPEGLLELNQTKASKRAPDRQHEVRRRHDLSADDGRRPRGRRGRARDREGARRRAGARPADVHHGSAPHGGRRGATAAAPGMVMKVRAVRARRSRRSARAGHAGRGGAAVAAGAAVRSGRGRAVAGPRSRGAAVRALRGDRRARAGPGGHRGALDRRLRAERRGDWRRSW